MTIEGKPNYYFLDTAAMDDAEFFSDEEKLQFFNAMIQEHKNALDPDFKQEETSGKIGRAIHRMHLRFREGIVSYFAKVGANPYGRKGKPLVNQSLTNDYPLGNLIEQNRTEQEKKRTELNQTEPHLTQEQHRKLIQLGFSSEEICSAVNSISWDTIQWRNPQAPNPYGYILSVLQRNKSSTKAVVAQQYTQRTEGYPDETPSPEQMLAQVQRYMEEGP